MGITMNISLQELIMSHCMYIFCFTSSRNGPNWRSLVDPLGQWRETLMLPAALTMEKSSPSCYLLEEWMIVAALWVMHGFWMSTLGGGGRWVVLNGSTTWVCTAYRLTSIQIDLYSDWPPFWPCMVYVMLISLNTRMSTMMSHSFLPLSSSPFMKIHKLG